VHGTRAVAGPDDATASRPVVAASPASPTAVAAVAALVSGVVVLVVGSRPVRSGRHRIGRITAGAATFVIVLGAGYVVARP